MSSLAPVGASIYGSVRAAGLYLARVLPGFTNPAVLRTNNKARQYAAFGRRTRHGVARRCAER